MSLKVSAKNAKLGRQGEGREGRASVEGGEGAYIRKGRCEAIGMDGREQTP